MKWLRFFIGGHQERTRPVYQTDAELMRRLEEARLRLGAVEVKPVRSVGGGRVAKHRRKSGA